VGRFCSIGEDWHQNNKGVCGEKPQNLAVEKGASVATPVTAAATRFCAALLLSVGRLRSQQFAANKPQATGGGPHLFLGCWSRYEYKTRIYLD
jgi:hypothetical protein